VFEAVDVQWEAQSRAAASFKNKRAARNDNDAGGGRESSSEGGGVKATRCGETTEAETEAEYEEDNGSSGNNQQGGMVNTDSLVVLKCLKPVTERKIRRELLVLTHCATLPNLARVIGIVLPDSMDNDDDDDNDNEDDRVVGLSTTTSSATGHPRKRRRHHSRLQRDNIGSITDAASVEVVRHKKSPATIATTTQAKNSNKGNTHHGTQLPALVLEHAGQNCQWFCHPQQPTQNGEKDQQYLTEYEMKYYLCHLLLALDGLHAAGIMHRDVKPRNTLINRFLPPNNHHDGGGSEANDNNSLRKDQPLVLVDLGLADFYHPGTKYNVRVASRHYKSPELLIGYHHYDYAIDMWSVGCILAGLLFRKEPFFRGKDNEDQLGKIVSVLGTRDFLTYCRKCDVRLTGGMRAAIGKYCSRAAMAKEASSSSSSEEAPSSLLDNDMGRRTPWMNFLCDPTCPVPSADALDLLDGLLVYDHERRWTAREALGHAFFDDVRERVLREVRERMAWEERRDAEKERSGSRW